MISKDEALNKLYDLPVRFRTCMHNRQYANAKYIYDKAIILASFLEVDIETKITLFGNTPYKEEEDPYRDGMFPEAMVKRCLELTSVKGNHDAREYLHEKAMNILKFDKRKSG